MPRLDLDGATVAYADSGAGETVLLLHSSAGSGAQWRSLTDKLQSRYRVVAPDLYGYGDTGSWPGRAFPKLADEAALADAVLGSSNAPVHVVGHSYGGAVALRFALDRPDRVKSLTLIEPVAFHLLHEAPPGSPDRSLYLEIIDLAGAMSRAECGGYGRAMARFVDYWNGDGAWAQLRPDQQSELARRGPKVALDFWATLTEPASLRTYQRIDAPTLILRGTRSPQPVRRIAELLTVALPEARLRSIDGAGHMLPLTHRDAVNAAVLDHLLDSAGRLPQPVAA